MEFRDKLSPIYPREEAESLVFWLMEEYLQMGRLDLLKETELDRIPDSMEMALNQLLLGYPIQYITGRAPFYGREFFVDPSVLIPRNETEELVHWIIEENKGRHLKILDAGTGSGCIAITLALELPQAEVTGLDISAEALKVAGKNASFLLAKLDFLESDILKSTLDFNGLDIIVSNPPYVREQEKENMKANVLGHEPHSALFVPDKDPLLFYRAIAQKGLKALKPGGKIYFEINEGLGQETVGLLQDLGYSEVRLHKDLNSRDRMVCGVYNCRN